MEVILKKFQKKYTRAKDEKMRWDELQSELLSQFGNASAIINRLQVLREDTNYDALAIVPGIRDRILCKQLYTLNMLFSSMKDTLQEFHRIVMSFDKILRDALQLLKGSTTYQMQVNVGKQPSLQQHLDGLKTFLEMHKSEYLLKCHIVSLLAMKYSKCSAKDLAALRQLLIDQPNIPKDEVESLFNIITEDD